MSISAPRGRGPTVDYGRSVMSLYSASDGSGKAFDNSADTLAAISSDGTIYVSDMGSWASATLVMSTAVAT